MAIKSFELVGNWKRNAPKRGFNDTDIKLLTCDKAVDKIRRIFSNSRYDFRLVFARVPNGRDHLMTGAVDSQFVSEKLGLNIEPDDDCITVICTNNSAAQRITLTGWMIAHRIGHVLTSGGSGFWSRSYFYDAFDSFNTKMYRQLNVLYGAEYQMGFEHYQSRMRWMRGIYEAIGTMRSARRNLLPRPTEFGFELIAQHIIQGRITLNDTPERIRIQHRKAWGRDNSVYSKPIQNESEDRIDSIVGQFEGNIESALSESYGSILVM